MRRCLILLVLLACLTPASAPAELALSGALRNDALVLVRGERGYLFDVLEQQLVLERRADDWRFYGDVRVTLLGGDPAVLDPDAAGLDTASVRLLRGFVRYHAGPGDFTLGKTYANFGVPGVFNPFELDRSVYATDLGYTKEGILALTYESPLGPLSGWKAFVSPAAERTPAAGGAGAYTHLGTFDLGAVVQRRDRDENLAGVHFKGDLELGVQAAWAWHFRDDGAGGFSEANAGLDYSFWDGRIIVSVLGYYLETSLAPAGDSTTAGALGAASVLSGFTARYYAYASLVYVPDEFFQARLDAFVNGEDGSALLIPGATWVLADGLNLTLEALVPTGAGPRQYSRDAFGDVIGLLRMEAKL